MIIVDFETAIHNAVYEKYDQILVVGCRFHLRQAWFRHNPSVSLQVENHATDPVTGERTVIGMWLRYVFGLTFLYPSEVYDGFINDLLSIKPPFKKVD